MFRLQVLVNPSSKIQLLSTITEEGIVKINIRAPPIDSEANKEVIRFIGELLGYKRESHSRKNIQIISGQKSKLKTLLIEDEGGEGLMERLREKIGIPY